MKKSFFYVQANQTLTVNIVIGKTVDIDSIIWNGADVYDLLESFDQLDDIIARAEAMADGYETVSDNDPYDELVKENCRGLRFN